MRIAPPDVLTARVDAVRQRLDRDGLDGLVVTSLSSIAYLSGLFASAATLVLTSDALLLMGTAVITNEGACGGVPVPATTP